MAGDDITLTTTVREVMTRYPHAEAVFNKHGLTGCGGRKGPMEPIGFFATVHHVDPNALLAELRTAANEEPDQPTGHQAVADQPDIYKMFVKAALAVVITVGCTLGAINLAAMAMAGVTGSYWEAITQAHGHAQIFGWVGLFIMGVSYHVLPRLKATELQHRPLAMASFWLVLAGLSIRMVAQPMAESPSWAGIVVFSAVCELFGASFFAFVIIRTLKSNPGSADFWDKYVVASGFWFLVTAAATVGISLHTAANSVAVIPPGLDAPYLHVSLVGFALMMIFGITLRTIPVFMGLRTPDPRAFGTIFWMLNLSIVLKVGSGWSDALTGSTLHAFAAPAGGLLEYISVLAFVYYLGVLGKAERNISEEGVSRNYEKFVRAAYFWLVVAATMSAVYTVYHATTSQVVPHALVGAYRHALTVGFISLIIMGMAARIIPVFTGVRLHSDVMLLGSFVLVNLGNTVRVVSQPLADMVGGPFFVTMGVSGFVEVAGLSLFVYNLWRTIDSSAEEEMPVGRAAGPISGNMIVADVLAGYPASLEVLVAHGFSQLRSPIGRQTLARAVTIEEACRMRGVDLSRLLADLNANKGQPTQPETGTDSYGARANHRQTEYVSPDLVRVALRTCYDPEIPVNIVDLGLVRGVKIDGGTVGVRMTLTAPECPMGTSIVDDVRQTISQLPGVRDVQVHLDFDPPWTPDAMSDDAKRQLGMMTA